MGWFDSSVNDIYVLYSPFSRILYWHKTPSELGISQTTSLYSLLMQKQWQKYWPEYSLGERERELQERQVHQKTKERGKTNCHSLLDWAAPAEPRDGQRWERSFSGPGSPSHSLLAQFLGKAFAVLQPRRSSCQFFHTLDCPLVSWIRYHWPTVLGLPPWACLDS